MGCRSRRRPRVRVPATPPVIEEGTGNGALFFCSSSIHPRGTRRVAAQAPAGRRALAAGSRFSLRRTSPAFAGAGSVLSRARAIHGALVAAPGRQDTAHADVAIGALVEAT